MCVSGRFNISQQRVAKGWFEGDSEDRRAWVTEMSVRDSLQLDSVP